MCDFHKLTSFSFSILTCKMRILTAYQIHRVPVDSRTDGMRDDKYEVTDILPLVGHSF